jgi:crotonobetainyl-CoA:carnitine CoA-transferase CaiB-like acyl-CoA transferase
MTAGMSAVIGALLALEARHRSGEGQLVDVSMMDALLSTMASSFASYLGSGIVPGPKGSGFATIVPYRTFPSADREITVAVGSDKLWERFCEAIQRADLWEDQRFRSNPQRVKHRNELEPLLADLFRSRPAAQWLEVLTGAGIPCSLVRNLQEVAGDEHVRARNMLPEVEHPKAGQIRVTGAPVKLSQTAAAPPAPAPALGEDTDAVLREVLGLTEQELAVLRRTGAIA